MNKERRGPEDETARPLADARRPQRAEAPTPAHVEKSLAPKWFRRVALWFRRAAFIFRPRASFLLLLFIVAIVLLYGVVYPNLYVL
ncbi:MAG TPA: hypothetical protein VGC64_04575, partial [Pyrinomonadaceae bacterium]